MVHRDILTALVLVLTVSATAGISYFSGTPSPSPAPVAEVAAQLLPSATTVTPPPASAGLLEPVPRFRDHITKKSFGMYITPDTSPIADDRFTGFHAGVDAEFTDATAAIPVTAIADGTVTFAGWLKGYGGVIVVRHSIAGSPAYALYGHLDAASLVSAGSRVRAGERLGLLGDDHSVQTDGVRKHLHFAIYTGETMDYRGYVPHQEDLAPWMDPLSLFR